MVEFQLAVFNLYIDLALPKFHQCMLRLNSRPALPSKKSHPIFNLQYALLLTVTHLRVQVSTALFIILTFLKQIWSDNKCYNDSDWLKNATRQDVGKSGVPLSCLK